MIGGLNFIDGEWTPAAGSFFESTDPATGAVLWKGHASTEADADAAVAAARKAAPLWSSWPLDDRIDVIEAFGAALKRHKEEMAELIARETGKPLWDALGEAGAMANKIPISIAAYYERTGEREEVKDGVRQRLAHRPHGVMAVFGPFNFPGHLPNGHIVPALLAGNTVVFKPSELTPAVAQKMVGLWQEAGLPAGALNLVHGAKEAGMALSAHDGVDGILFTGSHATGVAIHKQTAGQPGKILALEMGGNNPLIVHQVKDAEAAAILTVQSAYTTSGQRCTCARRLIVPQGGNGDAFVKALLTVIDSIRVGAWDETPEPFMGPLINEQAADSVLAKCQKLLEAGGVALRPPVKMERGGAFLTPAIIDVSDVPARPDEEIFGPVLQLVRVPDFDAAVDEANDTRFGLAAGLLSDDKSAYRQFYARARAGIVNWNRPLTGAASNAPFGGIAESGNHRPSAYYAADYSAYPVASLEDARDTVELPAPPKGLLITEAPAK